MIAAEVGKASAVTLQPAGPRPGYCVSTPSHLLTGPQNWRATEGFSPSWGPVQGGTTEVPTAHPLAGWDRLSADINDACFFLCWQGRFDAQG